jgi:hypothetical protein
MSTGEKMEGPTMTTIRSVELSWIRLAIGCGIATSVVYPSLIFIPLPQLATITLAAAVGPLLGIASVGLYRFLRVHQPSVSAQLAAACNFLGGALFSTMLLVQLAVRIRAAGQPVEQQVVAVWLGLDVAWDVYIALGTALFAWAMRAHPRFGLGFAGSGLLLAVLLLALNFFTFPEPPGESNLIDLGPLVGLWYLVVTVQMWRSLSWVKQALAAS